MSVEQQWISTVSMNRFYDHCYLIECAYHIISRYCCSFTNLLTHDDGSIPYYLVQKVKIAVEYGKILLISRYRPFQQQLRAIGVYDYIDQAQYECLCTLWNTIKAETQIVEMYFNQISLLIYPVVSSTTLPFLEQIEHDDVSALVKINAIIHSLVNYTDDSSCHFSENVATLLKSTDCSSAAAATAAVRYLNEEELGLFIVNSIIEPLFVDEDDYRPKSTTAAGAVSAQFSILPKNFVSPKISSSDRVGANESPTGSPINRNRDIFVEDLYDILKRDDRFLKEILVDSSSSSPSPSSYPARLQVFGYTANTETKWRHSAAATNNTVNGVNVKLDPAKKYDFCNGLRYPDRKHTSTVAAASATSPHHRAAATIHRFPITGYEEKFTINNGGGSSNGNRYEYVNKKFVDYSTNGKNFM